jgi:hypothetical protein
MRKIRIFGHISLAGVIAPPGDSDFANGGWSAPCRTPAGATGLAETQGKGFFSDHADPRELALVSTKAMSTGVLMNTYRHVGAAKPSGGGS